MKEPSFFHSSSPTTSKHVAKNTIVLFTRMFIVMFINLFIVRILVGRLGMMDYGIFNTVAGVILTAACVNVVLEVSLQRFYAIALGRDEQKVLKNVFASSVNIILFLSLFILVVFETLGLWFLHTQLDIPQERMFAADWIFQFSLFSFLAVLFQIPYTAAIFAHEDMGIYATISTIDCLLRLGVASVVGLFPIDPLVFYGLGLFMIAVSVLSSYFFIARRNYQECHYQKVQDKSLYRRILSFAGWALFGSLANVGLIQGNTLLLNIFFGPLVVSAFAIAIHVNNAFGQLCNSMVLAFRPAMIKDYASHQFQQLNRMFSICNKFILYVLTAVGIPFIAEMDTILNFWLPVVNDNIILFCRFIIIYVVCLALNNPISIIMHASGRIKEYNIPVESCTLLSVPITWLLFNHGFSPSYVFASMIGVCTIAHVVRLVCLHRYYSPFSIYEYILTFILPASIIIGFSVLAASCVHHNFSHPLCRLMVMFLVIPSLLLSLTYAFGLSKQERVLLTSYIQNYIHRRLFN